VLVAVVEISVALGQLDTSFLALAITKDELFLSLIIMK
jgi:hypothetical protein